MTVLAVVGIALYSEMAGRIAVVTGRTVFDLIRERTGARMGLATVTAPYLVNALALIAELCGVALAMGSAKVCGSRRTVRASPPSGTPLRGQGIAAPVSAAIGLLVVLLFCWGSQWLLLAGRTGWKALLAGAVATAVGWANGSGSSAGGGCVGGQSLSSSVMTTLMSSSCGVKASAACSSGIRRVIIRSSQVRSAWANAAEAWR